MLGKWDGSDYAVTYFWKTNAEFIGLYIPVNRKTPM